MTVWLEKCTERRGLYDRMVTRFGEAVGSEILGNSVEGDSRAPKVGMPLIPRIPLWWEPVLYSYKKSRSTSII